MEKLPENQLLQFHADTLENVRKLFDFEDPKRLEEAIDILQEWARKQNHFTVTEFDREYLEKIIITNKGLLERSKMRLDKICTIRTLLPEFFMPINIKTDLGNLDNITDAFLPQLTPDNYRVYLFRNVGKQFTSKFFLEFYIRNINFWQYVQQHDYNAGFILVYDLSEANLMEIITKMSLTDFRQMVTIVIEGYGARLREIYCISNSKLIVSLLDLVKPLLSKKLVDRLQFLSDKDLLKDKIPKDILPSDYGGKEKSLDELQQDWLDVISSDVHIEYMKQMRAVKTNELNRQVDKFNEEYLGMPGTFRSLSVD